MLEYSRIVRKKKAEDDIKWIEVISLEQLKPSQYFENVIDKKVLLNVRYFNL